MRANEGGEGGCDQILRDRFAFGARDRDQGSREVEVVHGYCQEETGHVVEVQEHVGQEGAVGPNKGNRKR